MILYLIGIDYKSSPIFLREPIYRKRNEIITFWQDTGEEAALLFTCNRIELYGVSENIFQAARSIKLFQRQFPQIFEMSYIKQGNEEVIEHALRLACGLESQIVGEEEIVRQLNSWINQDSFPYILKKIWKEVLVRTQDIRSKAGSREIKANIASIIFEDFLQRSISHGKKEVVIVGTGKIARLFSENKPEGINLYFAARKRHKRARQLARHSGSRAILLDDLPSLLLDTSALISATSSPHCVLKKSHFSNITEKRNKPLYVYDLAAPRDVEPEVRGVPGIFLQDLDALNPIFKEQNNNLYPYVKKAELLILHHIFEITGQIKENANVYTY